MSVPPEHVYSRWLDGPQSPPEGQMSIFEGVYLQPAYGSALPGEAQIAAEVEQTEKKFILKASIGEAALRAADPPAEESVSRVLPPAEPITLLWSRKADPAIE